MTTDTRNTTQTERFMDAFKAAVDLPIHLHDTPTLVAALEMVDMTNAHYAKIREIDFDKDKGYAHTGPLSASLEMLGAITRGMIAWHDKSELGQLAAIYRRERKLDAKKGGHAEHRTKMYQTNMKMQNILATMWKECE